MLLVIPFAHYSSFFALFCGTLPNSVIMAFNLDSFSGLLFCHLNHSRGNAFFLKKSFG